MTREAGCRNDAEAPPSPPRETEPLMPRHDYVAVRARWFILFYFSLASGNQSFAWFTFSSVQEGSVQEYFGERLTHSTIDLLLNWGPIIGMLAFPFQTWILERTGGLASAIRLGVHCVTLGCLIRVIPIALDELNWTTDARQTRGGVACYHLGQILVAFAGPFVMGTISRLACVWFRESERTIATAVAATSNGLGTTIGFLNSIWLATSPGRIPNIFYFSLGVAACASICAVAYCPDGPPTPPSAAAAETRVAVAGTAKSKESINATANTNANGDADELTGDAKPTSVIGGLIAGTAAWFTSVKAAGSNKSFVLLVAAASVLSGVFDGWSGLMQSFLEPAGLGERGVGWIGFGNGMAQIFGAIASGVVSDVLWQRRLKLGIVIGLVGCLATTLWFALQLPSAMWHGRDHVVPQSEATLVVAIALCGFFQGITSPLFYELAAELIYPLQEGMSAGILVCLLNASSGAVILLNDVLTAESMNVIMLVALVLVLLATIWTEEEYRRPRNDGPGAAA